MSTRQQPRLKDDAYMTPPALCDTIVVRIAQLMPEIRLAMKSHLLEPTAGTGNFVRAARDLWGNAVSITAVELARLRANQVGSVADCIHIADFFQWRRPRLYDLVLGNPPFFKAQEIVERILGASSMLVPGTGVLAFFLRLGFLGSQKRTDFWRKYPLWKLIPVVPRPRFMLDKPGTDFHDYGVFLWKQGFTGDATLEPHITWEGN